MSLDRIWSGWRLRYVESHGTGVAEHQVDIGDGDGSIFERILATDEPDDRTYIVHRGRTCFVILNIYPYTNGHLMVLPYRCVAELDDLTDEEAAEMWALVTDGVRAIKTAYDPDGVNVGLNLGRAGGAGFPDHLHVHCLPRWHGDTNFMTSIAETRVMPESLDSSWRRLRDAWPSG